MSATLLQRAITREDGCAEVSAQWVHANRDAVHLIDVRAAHELQGELGAIDGIEHVPMDQLLTQIGLLDAGRPVVLVCRSGRRSGMVVGAFEAAGYDQIASMRGGMIAWHEEVLADHDVHLGAQRTRAQSLAEAIYNTNGVPEVSPDWVHAHMGQFRLVDVREANELTGPLGHLAAADHLPLGSVMQGVQGWDRAAPVVVLCRSGGRSARAALAMLAEGFETVASMEGGMIAWGAAGLPHQ